jgi:hypothetical protein
MELNRDVGATGFSIDLANTDLGQSGSKEHRPGSGA